MRPKKHMTTGSNDLFRARLSPLMAACSSLASDGKVMAFGCTVVSMVTRLRS